MARRRTPPSGLLGRVQQFGFDRGVLGRSRAWLGVWALLWIIGKVRGRGTGEVLLSERLEPGQRIVIANDLPAAGEGPLTVRRSGGGRIKPRKPPRGRRARRRSRRDDRRSERA